jgi:hypothetical protein
LKKSCVSRVHGGGATRVGIITVCVDRLSADAPKKRAADWGPCFVETDTLALQRKNGIIFRGRCRRPLLSWKDGLGRTPLLVRTRVAGPVVVPGFMLDLVASVAALPSLEAGCICADAVTVVSNSAATARVESAICNRMAISSLDCVEERELPMRSSFPHVHV